MVDFIYTKWSLAAINYEKGRAPEKYFWFVNSERHQHIFMPKVKTIL